MSVLAPTPATPARPPLTHPTALSQESESQYVVNAARSFLGTPYVWGGESRQGVDCSALLQLVWKQAGVSIPRTTFDQYQTGTPVAANQLRPGDAVFFRGSDPRGNLPGHVGIYIGGDKIIEAPHTGASVEISSLGGRSDYVGARRYGDGGSVSVPAARAAAAGVPVASAPAQAAGVSQQALAALRALLAQAPAKVPTVTPQFSPLTAAATAPSAPVAAFRSPLLGQAYANPLASLR